MAENSGENRKPYSQLRCRDIMTRNLTVATPETVLQEVARMMREADTGIIPIVEAADETNKQHHGKLTGLITDRDIVVRSVAEGKDITTAAAGEFMTIDIYAAQGNDRVFDVIRRMGDKQVRRVPVVDADGNLQGIISMADIALETENDKELAEVMEEISSGASFWSKK